MVNMGEAFAYDRIVDQECERVPLTDSERARYLLETGDLLFVRQSLKFSGAGRCVLVCHSKESRTWDSHLIRVRLDPSLADPRFYFYYFRSPFGRRRIEAIIEQVAAAGIRGSDLRRVDVPATPLDQQRSIADLLSALDDKIAANDRVVHTSLDLGLATYEDASSSSEWRTIGLDAAAKWYSGGTPPTNVAAYWDGDIPWISAASLKSPFIDDSDRRVTELGAINGTRMAPVGSVIFVVRGMSLMTEFRIGITQREVAFGQDCKALVPVDGVPADVLFHAIRSRTSDILCLVDAAGHGTGRLATDRIEKLEVRIPTRPEDATTEALRTLDQLAANAKHQSSTLAALRDTLLPGLMSGEIRVREAEKVVEEVV
jgi:type I restriction enzyme S subunit